MGGTSIVHVHVPAGGCESVEFAGLQGSRPAAILHASHRGIVQLSSHHVTLPIGHPFAPPMPSDYSSLAQASVV